MIRSLRMRRVVFSMMHWTFSGRRCVFGLSNACLPHWVSQRARAVEFCLNKTRSWCFTWMASRLVSMDCVIWTMVCELNHRQITCVGIVILWQQFKQPMFTLVTYVILYSHSNASKRLLSLICLSSWPGIKDSGCWGVLFPFLSQS